MPNHRAAGRLRTLTLTALALLVGITASGTPAVALPAPPPAAPAVPVALAGVAPVARYTADADVSPAASDTAAHLAVGDDSQLAARPSARTGPADGRLLLMLAAGTTVTGAPTTAGRALAARSPSTSNPVTNAGLAKVGARSMHPLLPELSGPEADALAQAARGQLGADSVDLAALQVVDIGATDPVAAARTLSATAGVAFAEPDRYVDSMATPPLALPTWAGGKVPDTARAQNTPGSGSTTLPTNYGLTTSLLSYLNAGGVDATGAYDLLGQRYGQLPGTGEIITNVSIGDLTDQSMADAGDPYVRTFGPTTVVRDGQRYLDVPSMPLIPTYTVSPNGQVDPTGSTEHEDPNLGEVLLDFGVMAPLPHDRQRPDGLGSGVTDLLGIAPGAQYRLVVPQEPTINQIAVALVAAANQTPRPDVITASVGFGTDAFGFPGRYLEDDPVLQAVIAGIVHRQHIVVCVSSNDGTRLYTPTAVGPDGGSTPTDLVKDPRQRTTIDDDAYSTVPSRVLDSGAIAAGGSTLDDTLGTPARATSGTVAETRISGAGNFSSGFGTRVDLSAPSDGIVTYEHRTRGAAQDVQPVISGGTSASAPEIAAAAAVVLQTARLTGRAMDPTDVRALLERTGRAVPTPAAIDRTLQVGPQIDVAAAVEALLAAAPHRLAPEDALPDTTVLRVSVAHRVTVGLLGGEFLESTDPTVLDLAGPNGTGEGLTGPVTFGLDVTGLPAGGHFDYVLRVGDHEVHAAAPSIRVLPADLLAAAGLPLVSAVDRQVAYSVDVRRDGSTLARAERSITIGPTDGGYAEATAPAAPATARAGQSVTVHYDLTGVRRLQNPQLVVSTVGHWSPVAGPLFNPGYTVNLTDTAGTVTLPASAFGGGSGLYGIGIVQISGSVPLYGEFTPIGIRGTPSDPAAPGTAPAGRPDAPMLSTGGGFGHLATVSRAAPDFSLRYDVSAVPGAAGAALEISAPAPTVFGSLNTVTNANGNTRDTGGATAGSVYYQRLTQRSGTLQRNALQLGIPTSMSYDIRVLATDRNGTVIGQASPTSLLTVNDGLAPGGATVDSFGIAGRDSVAAVHDGAGASVLRYAPDTGTYGAALTRDENPDGRYEIFGVDTAMHRVLVMHWNLTSSDQQVQTYDTATGQLVASADVPGSAYHVLGGRVDPARHRAALLARHQPDNADAVLPVDINTGALGAAIPADAPGVTAGKYLTLDIDTKTGQVDLAHVQRSLICFGAAVGNVAKVDLDTGTVTASQSATNCAYAFASDGPADQLYQLTYRSFSVNILGTSTLVPVARDTLEPGDALPVRTQFGLTMAIDSAHRLALVAFPTPTPKPVFGVPGGQLTDSNSTSQLAVVDLATGETVKVVTGLNLVSGFGGPYNPSGERSIQLDPAAHTGWTYGPGAEQIQQFSY